MKNGFIKLGVAVPSLQVANCKFNTQKIIELSCTAADNGCSLLVFPELSLTASTCGDLFFREALLRSAESSLVYFMNETKSLDMLIFVGLPIRINSNLYNAVAAVCHGELLGIIPKTNIPHFNGNDEMRRFHPAPKSSFEISYAGQSCVFGTDQIFFDSSMPSFKVAAELGNDAWSQLPPSARHCHAGATIIVNSSASPEAVGKPCYRCDTVKLFSGRQSCAYLYSSAGQDESTTDLVFSGHSFICENGTVLAENKPFEGNELLLTEVDIDRLAFSRSCLNDFCCEQNPNYSYREFSLPITETKLTRSFDRHPFIPNDAETLNERAEFILNMQSFALAKRLRHTASSVAVVGVSGGLDSTLALIVAERAMKKLNKPSDCVLAITMPCFGTGSRTRSNAQELCERLGVSFECINIKAAVKQHLSDIGHDESTYDVTYENAQARERTQVLMDIANSRNGLVVGTGDLSEVALGWSTFNGDHMAMYGVNCGVPKTLIRYIVKCYADKSDDAGLRRVLYDILDTPISPELVPSASGEIAQRTEEILGDYDLHDFFLYYFIRSGYDPEKLYRVACIAFDGAFTADYIKATLRTFIKRFIYQQFKRSCCPDGVKIGSVALSPRGDWRMPSDAATDEWLEQLERL